MAEASDPPHLVQMIQLKSVGGKRENDQHQGEENLFEKEFEFSRLNEQVILWHFNCGLLVHRSVGLNLAFGNYGIARGLVCAFHQQRETLLGDRLHRISWSKKCCIEWWCLAP